MGKRIAITTIGALISTLSAVVIAQSTRPRDFPNFAHQRSEGSRVEITGKNFPGASAVLLGTSSAAFSLISPETLVTLIPYKSITSTITVVTPQGRASSPLAFVIANDPRVRDEVSYKAGYVNAVAPPAISSRRYFGESQSSTPASQVTNPQKWRFPRPSSSIESMAKT